MSLKDSQQIMSVELDNENEIDIDEVRFYWEIHPTEKAQMSESFPHHYLMLYLEEIISFMLRDEKHVVAGNVAVYADVQDTSDKNRPLEPDLMLVKGVRLNKRDRGRLRSWKIGPKRPAPNVVFEFASEGTWPVDLTTKVTDYPRIQVREYFAYDPNVPQYYDIAPVRLKGWRYENGQPIEIQPNDEGWLWSNELDSYLVPDGTILRLHDREGNRRLKESEAERAAKETERKAKEKAQAEKAKLEAENEELRRIIEELRRQQGLQ
jgi:hypothetical protein